MRQSLKGNSDDKEDLWQEVARCSAEYGTSVHAVPNDNRELFLLFWQSPIMKQMYERYPSVLFMDGTYKINNRGMPLYSLLVCDGEGKGQVVAYAVVREETTRAITKLLELFCEHNVDATDKLQVVVVDKDYAEITAIGSVFGNASIVLCKMHVLDAFRRSFKSHNLSVSDRDALRDSLHAMVHGRTESAYSTAKEELMSISESYTQYFLQHWEPIKHMWAGYKVHTLQHLGFTTNNFVESHNAKIKHVLNHHSRLADVVNKLALLEATKLRERNVVLRRQMKTRIRIAGPQGSDMSVTEAVHQVATLHAAKLIMGQIKKSEETVTVMQQTTDNNYNVQIGEGRQHTVSDLSYCECCHFVTTGLPCAHIYVVREKAGLSKFAAEQVPERWTRQAYAQTMRSLEQANVGVIDTATALPRTQPSSAQEKYREASVTTDAILNVLAEKGHVEFGEKVAQLKYLLDVWKAGGNVIMEEIQLEQNADNSTDDLQTETSETSEEIQLEENTEDRNDDLQTETSERADVVEAEENVSGEEQTVAVASTSGVSNMTNDVTEIELPRVIKKRGRPKGSGQTVIGTKRKLKTVPVRKRKNPVVEETQADMAVVKRRKTRRDVQKSTVQDRVNDDLCYLCWCEDPPSDISRDEVVMWTACESNCGRWFHNTCLASSGRVNTDDFICRWCNSSE